MLSLGSGLLTRDTAAIDGLASVVPNLALACVAGIAEQATGFG